MQIKMAHAGFEFIRYAAHPRAARRENFHFDAVAIAKLIIDLFFQLGAGRH
jgi:hypothetical protein